MNRPPVPPSTTSDGGEYHSGNGSDMSTAKAPKSAESAAQGTGGFGWPPSGPVGDSTGGGGSGGRSMAARVDRLEDLVGDIRVEIRGMSAALNNVATRKDVSDMKTSIIQWVAVFVLGSILAIGTLGFFYGQFIGSVAPDEKAAVNDK